MPSNVSHNSIGRELPDADYEEIVIRIHGTFAQSDQDEGGKWWQIGQHSLCSEIAGLFHLRRRDLVFHWSGENSEIERLCAAEALDSLVTIAIGDIAREKLRSGARTPVRLHFIAHSHGGNVVLYCLLMQLLKTGKDSDHRGWLDDVLSVTTVGTPFILPRMSQSLWLGRMRAVTPARVQLLIDIGVAGILSLLYTGVTYYDSLLVVYLVLFATVSAAIVSGLINRRSVEVGRILDDAGAQLSRLERVFGRRWYAIHSSRDEAILALGEGAQFNRVIFPPVKFWNLLKCNWTYRGHLLGTLWSFASYPVYRLGLRFLNPMLARMIRSRVLGNPVGQRAVAAKPYARCSDGELSPELESLLRGRVEDSLVRQTRTLSEQLFPLLSWVSGKTSKAPMTLESDDLVHTSYFEMPEIRQMITTHMRRWRNEDEDYPCEYDESLMG